MVIGLDCLVESNTMTYKSFNLQNDDCFNYVRLFLSCVIDSLLNIIWLIKGIL